MTKKEFKKNAVFVRQVRYIKGDDKTVYNVISVNIGEKLFEINSPVFGGGYRWVRCESVEMIS